MLRAPLLSQPQEARLRRLQLLPVSRLRPDRTGFRWYLTKAQINGDILTVEVQYSGPPPLKNGGTNIETRRFPIPRVSYVDDATSRKYSVLKDTSGVWQASPIGERRKDEIHFLSKTNSPQVVWFKFPAPPAESQTVSITIPNVGPFNGVRVQR